MRTCGARSAGTCGLLVLMLAAPGLCGAQPQPVPNAGTILRQTEPPVLTLPRKPPPEIQLEPPARPELKPAPEARFALKALRITGSTAFAESELLPLVAEFVGREVGFAELEQAAARITRYYRERGYLLARAYLPAQEIAAGSVEIAVLEGRLGKIDIRNRSRVRDSVIAAHVEPLRGRIVDERTLERRLLLIYDLPGVAPAQSTFQRGAQAGEADLALELAPSRALTGGVELDNFGNRYNGKNRVSAQASLHSPTGSGDRLTVGATKASGLEIGRLAYELPLDGDGLRLGAAHTLLHYELGENFAALDASGKARTTALYVAYPFVRSRAFNLNGQASAEFRKFEDRQDATFTVSNRNTRFGAFTLNADLRDQLGGGGISVLALGFVNGRVDIETPAILAIDAASANTHGSYSKWTLNALRLQRLTERTSLYFSFNGQYAEHNLDSSEQIILGGANGVRAYPQGEAPGDSGYVLSAELRYDIPISFVPSALQLVAFIDTGRVTISHEPFAAGDNHRRLSGAGIGLSWSRVEDFQVRVMLATRLGNARATSDADDSTRAWLHAVKYF